MQTPDGFTICAYCYENVWRMLSDAELPGGVILLIIND